MSPVPELDHIDLSSFSREIPLPKYNDPWGWVKKMEWYLKISQEAGQIPIKILPEGHTRLPIDTSEHGQTRSRYDVSAVPLVEFLAPSTVLRKIGEHAIKNIENKDLADYFRVELWFEQKTEESKLPEEHLMIKCLTTQEEITIFADHTWYSPGIRNCTGSTIFVDNELLVGGLMVCPAEVFAQAKKGIIIGDCDHPWNNIIALPGSALLKAGAEKFGQISSSIKPDVLYPLHPEYWQYSLRLLKNGLLDNLPLLGIKTRPEGYTSVDVSSGGRIGNIEQHFYQLIP